MKAAPPITDREKILNVRFLTEEQLAKELSITRASLLSWRNQGMPYVPLGQRMVRYNLYDVLDWLRERKTARMTPRAA